MDFGTRDHYRHAVEAIARLGPLSETEVARQAVNLCAEALALARGETADVSRDSRRTHVGFYLIGAGRVALERSLGLQASRWLGLARRARARVLPLYAGAIVLGTLVFSAAALFNVPTLIEWPWWGVLALGLVLLLATSPLAVSLVNWLVTLFVAPQPFSII